jgi:hypothetical protein
MDLFNRTPRSNIYLYWERVVIEDNDSLKYSLYVAHVGFRDCIVSFRNIGGTRATVANMCFQEELFY